MEKETLKEAKHNCEGCQGKGYLDKTDGYDYGKVVCPVCINDKEPKQETLEEAAKKFYPSYPDGIITDEIRALREGFIKGCIVGAERMYSEEEAIQLLIKFNQEIQEVEDVRDWFNQNKKK
jgi:hypothetical protein